MCYNDIDMEFMFSFFTNHIGKIKHHITFVANKYYSKKFNPCEEIY